MNMLVGQYVGRSSPDEMRKQVLRFLPLVKYIVRRMATHLPRHVELEDLESVGVLGLMEAVRRFDPTRGAAFKTFAYEHIRGAILGDLRKRDIVSRPMRKKIRNLEKAESDLTGRLGRPPDVSETADEMGIAEEDIERILLAKHTHAVLSLDGDDGGRTGQTLLSGIMSSRTRDPQEIAASRELIGRLADAMSELKEAEQQVLVLYYSKGLLQREIGGLLGVTESRVCQIHARAVGRLERLLKERPGAKDDE